MPRNMDSSHFIRQPDSNNIATGKSIRFKLTLAVILFGTLTTGIVSILMFTSTRTQMRNDFKQRLRDVVSIGALNIDAVTHDRLILPEQEGSPDYLRIKSVLKKIKANAEDIHFVYTMRLDGEGRIMFVVDETDNPDEIAHLGEIYTDASPYLIRNFSTLSSPGVEEDFYTDRWGTWLTGYAPILDKAGKRVGVLGIDIKAANILAYERKLLGLFTAIFFVSILFSSLLGAYLGKRFSDPILALKNHAEKIGSGDFESKVMVENNDELGILANTFNSMTAKLRELVGSLQTEISSRHAAEKKFRSIFDNAMEGIFQSSLNGKLLTANPAFALMLGYESPAEAMEQIECIPEQLYADKEQRQRIRSALESEGVVSDLKIRMLKKDNSEIWTELSAKLVQENDTEPFIEGLLKDISEKLARESAEREQQVAEAASQAKSEFLANMSHEIRTPMNAVMGLTHLALKTDLTSKQEDYLKKILNAARSLLRIINDILDFSKIEAGKLAIESIPFDIEESMNNLADIFGFKADEKNLELLFQFDKEVPTALEGDPLRLEQILTNLMSNAVKFTEKGNIVVSIRNDSTATTQTEEEVPLLFTVKDTGIGLSKSQAKKLFQSFTQADDSTTRKYGGTGLGLSICKSLVELMNGRIWVESEPGQGSAFHFTAVFKKQVAKTPRVLNYPSDLKGMKILVVDDNITAREIICEMLESFSFRAYQSPSGYEALADLKQAQSQGDPFKLVIMDWKMPGMDGIEASQLIRNHKDLSQIPSVLMLTAYSHGKIQQKAEKVGIQSFLLKPVNPSLLFDTIISVFTDSKETRTKRVVRDDIRIEGLDQVRGASILLVEDYEINRQIATELLESEGFRVTSAANGKTALELLSEGKSDQEFDLVLMDIQMPEMDGYTATRKIRELPTQSGQIPIVAMTAHALQSEKEKCFAVGMNDHIAKPIDPNRLIESLVRWIKPGDRKVSGKPSAIDSTPDPKLPELNLEYFDQTSGLSRVAGNKKLYLELLIKFTQKHATAAREIQLYLEQNEFEKARTLSHAVKGMAGNLGATELQLKAEDLEEGLKSGLSDNTYSHLQSFQEALDLAISEVKKLQHLCASIDTKPESGDADHGEIQSILTELQSAIVSDFGTALKIIEHLKSLSKPVETELMIESLLAHLEAFEEKEALECIDRLLDLNKPANGGS